MKASIQSLHKALPIVAANYGDKFDVNVVITGNEASTNGKTIRLPELPNGSHMTDVLWGFLAHEAAHVRYTNMAVFPHQSDLVTKTMLNIIEDVRIEGELRKHYPGTKFTIEKVFQHSLLEGRIESTQPDDHPAKVLLNYLLCELRSRCLQQTVLTQKAQAARNILEQQFSSGWTTRLDALLFTYMPRLRATEDALALTLAIVKMIEDFSEEEDSSANDDSPQETSSQPDSEKGEANEPPAQHQDQSQTNDDPSARNEGQEEGKNDQIDNPSNQSSQAQAPSTVAAQVMAATTQDLPDDLFESVRQQLESESTARNRSHYIDTRTGRQLPNQRDTSELHDALAASARLRSSLSGLLQARSQNNLYTSRQGRRLDTRRLQRLSTGDDRIFSNEDTAHEPNTALHLLLDCSGSMSGIRQTIANQACASLALALTPIHGVEVEVSAFPGLLAPVSPVLTKQQQVRNNLGRFCIASRGGTPMTEAILYAARRLLQSQQHRRVMMVITDGEPNDDDSVIQMLKMIKGQFDVVAIGIETEIVKHLFENSVVINDVSELKEKLFHLSKALI